MRKIRRCKCAHAIIGLDIAQHNQQGADEVDHEGSHSINVPRRSYIYFRSLSFPFQGADCRKEPLLRSFLQPAQSTMQVGQYLPRQSLPFFHCHQIERKHDPESGPALNSHVHCLKCAFVLPSEKKVFRISKRQTAQVFAQTRIKPLLTLQHPFTSW